MEILLLILVGLLVLVVVMPPLALRAWRSFLHRRHRRRPRTRIDLHVRH
jgi:hypothetical protein